MSQRLKFAQPSCQHRSDVVKRQLRMDAEFAFRLSRGEALVRAFGKTAL